MGSYQSRSAHTLQDIWRDNWGKSYELVDQRLLSDVKNFTTPNGWNEFHLACFKNDVVTAAQYLKGNRQLEEEEIEKEDTEIEDEIENENDIEIENNEKEIENGKEEGKKKEGKKGKDKALLEKTNQLLTGLYISSVTKENNDVISFLIQHGANPFLLTRNGFSPLHLAACVGNPKNLIELLKSSNISPDVKGYLHLSPLHVAAAFGHEKIVKVLLEHGANPNVIDKNTFAPLHLASHFGHLKVVEELLNHGAQVDLETQNADTPFHLATYQNHTEIVSILVEKYNVNVNALDKDLCTPLHYCCRKGYLSLASFLLTHSANPNAKNVYEDTPLHTACYNGWVGICQLLIAHGGIDVSSENIYSETPLHAACTFGTTSTLIDLLLAQPQVDINHQGNDGHTPLHCACFNGHLSVVKVLIERGVDFRVCDREGSPPIKWAYQKGFDDVVEYLRSCYDDEGEVQEYETPSPLGKIRNVTKEKVEMLQVRGVLSQLKGQIPLNEVDFYEVIGQGSFGSVYKGKYKNKTVAIKKLKPGLFRARQELEKFCREIQILCELDHPNVIGFIGACTREPSQFCIMTEYARGGSLHSILHVQKRKLDVQKKIDIALDVAKGMRYLHNLPHPIIHRDLNPHNILLNEKGTALVADFGESRLILKKSSGMEEMTKQSGNLRYMAPEVFMQSGNYDEKADVYNYGLCIWELFAEKIPFEDLPSAAAAAEMAYNGTRPLLCSTWSEDLCHLIDSCWQIDPVDRLSFPQIVDILQTQRQSLQQTSNLIEETDNVNKLEMMFSTTNRKITKLNTRSRSFCTFSDSDYVQTSSQLKSRRPFSWVEPDQGTFVPLK